jgi:CBS domain-containing protein
MTARDIMSTDVVKLSERATIREAVALLNSTHHGALPVINDAEEVVGVLSYQDVMRLALPEYLDGVDLSFLPASSGFFPKSGEYDNLGDVPVKEVMRPGYLPEVRPAEPVAEVARVMLKDQARRVVVVDEGRLVGIITRGDVVRAIVQPCIEPHCEGNQ